eukprot:2041043-Prymnesium_polylepis.1
MDRETVKGLVRETVKDLVGVNMEAAAQATVAQLYLQTERTPERRARSAPSSSEGTPVRPSQVTAQAQVQYCCSPRGVPIFFRLLIATYVIAVVAFALVSSVALELTPQPVPNPISRLFPPLTVAGQLERAGAGELPPAPRHARSWRHGISSASAT